MGKLERKLDMSLVRRIKARPDGSLYIPRTEAKPIHTVKPPRAASSYRGAKRNADRIKGWPMATFAKSRPLAKPRHIALNRSAHLPYARSYAHATEISSALPRAA